METGDGEVNIEFNRKTLTFDNSTVKLLSYLWTQDSITLARFYAEYDEEFGHSELVAFLSDLVKEGLVVLSEP